MWKGFSLSPGQGLYHECSEKANGNFEALSALEIFLMLRFNKRMRSVCKADTLQKG